MLQQNFVCSECIVRNTSPQDREISQWRRFCVRGPRTISRAVCQCFPRQDLLLILAQGSVDQEYCSLGSINQHTPEGAGSVLENMISVDHLISSPHHSPSLHMNNTQWKILRRSLPLTPVNSRKLNSPPSPSPICN